MSLITLTNGEVVRVKESAHVVNAMLNNGTLRTVQLGVFRPNRRGEMDLHASLELWDQEIRSIKDN